MNAPVQLPVASKLGAALALAEAGLRVFPLYPNEKKPRILGWPMHATTDPQQIREWWTETPDANIGASAHNLLVVDIDPRNGGWETFARLEMTHGFPPTWMVETQGGGVHLYYALPAGVAMKNGKLGPGIDIKSNGGFVVAPGSTIDGRPYLWREKKSPRDLHTAAAPQWLIDQCKAPHPKSSGIIEATTVPRINLDSTLVRLLHCGLTHIQFVSTIDRLIGANRPSRLTCASSRHRDYSPRARIEPGLFSRVRDLPRRLNWTENEAAWRDLEGNLETIRVMARRTVCERLLLRLDEVLLDYRLRYCVVRG